MYKILSIFLLLVSSAVFAQNDEAMIAAQIIELHKDTKKIQDSVNVLIKECDIQIGKTTDSIAKHRLDKRLTQLWAIMDESLRNEALNDINFAMQHPDSHTCLLLVMKNMRGQAGSNYYREYQAVYDNFSAEIKASKEGITMSDRLQYFKQSIVGSVAPGFNYKDIDGNDIALSGYKGKKYVLLDFWASWCAPCIADHKYLQPIYTNFKNRGFEIISISGETDIAKWKKTIVKKKADIWKQICVVSKTSYCGTENTVTENFKNDGEDASDMSATYNLVDEKDSVQKNYYVLGIPHYVLIDKDGIIVGKWKGSGELNMLELEKLLNERIP